MRYLKQSTAFTFRIGPFLDEDDGKTAETGLTIAQADIQISKNGGAFAQTSDASPTTTHDADGWYQCPLTVTDTNTLGPLSVQIHVAGALPVWEHFMVMPANVYDSMFGADKLEVDVTHVEGSDATDQINAACDQALTDYDPPTRTEATSDKNEILTRLGTPAGADISADLATIDGVVDGIQTDLDNGTDGLGALKALIDNKSDVLLSGTAQGGSSNSITLAAATSLGNDTLNGCVVKIKSGTGEKQHRVITDFNGTTDVATVTPDWVTNPSSDSVYEIVPGSVNLTAVRDTAQTSGQDVVAKLNSIEADTQDLQTQVGTAGAGLTDLGGMSTGMKGEVNAEADTALSDYDPPTRAELTTDTNSILAKLLAYVQLLARSDSAIETDNATELSAINADEGSGAGDFSAQTDSIEAIRDRGDASWTTGGGGSITDLLNVQPVIPNDIDLANTATVRVGLMLTNALDDLPSTAEITPGTISIERKAIGGTSWSAVVTDAACSEQAGLIYYDEVFDAGSGYAEGDSIRITFKSQKITVSANDYEITDSNGVMFQTSIRQRPANAVLDALRSNHRVSGSFGEALYLVHAVLANLVVLDKQLGTTTYHEDDDTTALLTATVTTGATDQKVNISRT